MDKITNPEHILQCLIASEAIYDENPCDYIQKDETINTNSQTLNKLKELVRSSDEFLMRYMICTYSNKEMIICFRGTDPNNKNDIKTDLFIIYGKFQEFEGKVGIYLFI